MAYQKIPTAYGNEKLIYEFYDYRFFRNKWRCARPNCNAFAKLENETVTVSGSHTCKQDKIRIEIEIAMYNIRTEAIVQAGIERHDRNKIVDIVEYYTTKLSDEAKRKVKTKSMQQAVWRDMQRLAKNAKDARQSGASTECQPTAESEASHSASSLLSIDVEAALTVNDRPIEASSAPAAAAKDPSPDILIEGRSSTPDGLVESNSFSPIVKNRAENFFQNFENLSESDDEDESGKETPEMARRIRQTYEEIKEEKERKRRESRRYQEEQYFTEACANWPTLRKYRKVLTAQESAYHAIVASIRTPASDHLDEARLGEGQSTPIIERTIDHQRKKLNVVRKLF